MAWRSRRSSPRRGSGSSSCAGATRSIPAVATPSRRCCARGSASLPRARGPVPGHRAERRALAFAREVGYRSAVVAPLTARGRTLGAISLIRHRTVERYGEHEMDLVRDLGRRAAMASTTRACTRTSTTSRRRSSAACFRAFSGVSRPALRRPLRTRRPRRGGGRRLVRRARPARRPGGLGDGGRRRPRLAGGERDGTAPHHRPRVRLRQELARRNAGRGRSVVPALRGGEMATLLLLSLDPATGRLAYSAAAHPPPLVVAPDAEPSFLEEGRGLRSAWPRRHASTRRRAGCRPERPCSCTPTA